VFSHMRGTALTTTLLVGTIGFTGTATPQRAGNQIDPETSGLSVTHPSIAAVGTASCTDFNTLSRRVDFADVVRARHLLAHRDSWARQLSDFDLGVRQRKAGPTSLDEFLSFAANAGLGWTAVEESGWKGLIDKLSNAMKSLNVHVPNIDLVKTTGQEEFDAAYTRDRAIFLPMSRATRPATNPRSAYFLLAHEMFHVLSRADSHLRDNLYALLGFKRVKGFEYPPELEERRVSNPDAFQYLHALSVQTASGSVDVLPVNQSLLPLNEVIQLPNFFAALDIVLLAVDPGTGEVRRDSNGNLIRYNFGNTNWVPLMLRNSSFIIHPEEVLADNFATLMEWRSDGVLPATTAAGFSVNDVNLLIAIENVLADGCRN
jgi:hypothetical protein